MAGRMATHANKKPMAGTILRYEETGNTNSGRGGNLKLRYWSCVGIGEA